MVVYSIEPSSIDIDGTNHSPLPQWRAIPPRKAANLAVSSAEAIDCELEETSSDFITEIESRGETFRLYRSIHRKLHFDQIKNVSSTWINPNIRSAIL